MSVVNLLKLLNPNIYLWCFVFSNLTESDTHYSAPNSKECHLLASSNRCWCLSQRNVLDLVALPYNCCINRFLRRSHSSPAMNTSTLKDSSLRPLHLLGQDQRSRCPRCKLVKGRLIYLSSRPLTVVINLI